jgi:hypothetical protein
MKKLFFIALLLLVSCSTSQVWHETNCSDPKLFDKIRTALIKEGFEITTQSMDYISLRRSTVNVVSGNHTDYWIISKEGNNVIASARIEYTGISMFGMNRIIYLDDDNGDAKTWYVAVMKILSRSCTNLTRRTK